MRGCGGSVHDQARAVALGELVRFRHEFYSSLTRRSDALLCADGPVRTLVGLILVAEHRRGHGAMYDALNHGRVVSERFRRMLASLPLLRTADGRIVLAVDVRPWLRSDARPARSGCSPEAADRWTWLVIAAHTQL